MMKNIVAAFLKKIFSKGESKTSLVINPSKTPEASDKITPADNPPAKPAVSEMV